MKTTNRTMSFLNLEYAQGFCDGVEYVNDSALEVLRIVELPDKQGWEVQMHDEDEERNEV